MTKFDRCIKSAEESTIYMVRERTKSIVPFKTWDDYVEAGKPPYAIVSQEELGQYRKVRYFRG